MGKTRLDIVAATFLVLVLIILGNVFVNINKDFYRDVEKRKSSKGYPANAEAIFVTNIQELLSASEERATFAIVTDSDNVKKTNYYSQLNGSEKIGKWSAVSVLFNRSLNGAYFDRMYIVELEDGHKVPILMMDGILDLSEDTVTLPLGEVKSLSKKPDYLIELNKKYELSEYVDEQWYVDASGKNVTIFQDFMVKAETLENTNWTIFGVGFVLYTIVSTIIIVKRRKKNKI